VERMLSEWGGDEAVSLAAPLSAVLADASYDRALALEVETIARTRDVRWPLRRLAVLMLESLLVRIDGSDTTERRFWIRRFGMTNAAELAREGFAPDEPITTQLWRRLARLRRIHRLTLSARTSDRALRDFLRGSDRECRLTLSRYLFTTDEVIARIEHDVRRSSGITDIARYGQYTPERTRLLDNLPRMERAIAEELMRDGVIRWAATSTASAINSLVEFPIGTVVVVVKPPGSTHELEIKRAGRPRDLPLDVVWARNEWIVPASHHLDGGAMHQLLAFEAENSAFLSRVFREVHGFDAAMSRTLHLATISAIPTPQGEVSMLRYFTDPRVFGARYESMRWHMRETVKTLAGYENEPFVEPFNDLALTGNFLGRVKPAQAIEIGTTSFRLDRLERYLNPRGAERYFGDEGQKVAHDADDDRRFADEILDEILGDYEPPRVPWRSHAQYVEAAFRVPANRARANRNYISVLAQIGTFWGTLLAVRGHTQGESFVERNCGLRSVWENGEWRVRVVFMDHDSLSFASIGTNSFRPKDSLYNAAKDAKHVLGGVYGKDYRVRGELWWMRRIFRAGSSVERQGLAAFRAAMKSAYDKTHDAIRTNADLGRFFHSAFVEKLRDWDDIVSAYMKTPKTRAARNAWRAQSHDLLASRGYGKELAEEHVNTVTRQAKFLRRVSFLY
jgi:hypothetical protein